MNTFLFIILIAILCIIVCYLLSLIIKLAADEPRESIDYHQRQMECYRKAIELNKEGKEFNHELSESNKMALFNLQQMGVKKVEISAGGNSCSSCRRQRKKYRIEDALAKMPLPNPKCTLKVFTEDGKGFCRCMYIPAD